MVAIHQRSTDPRFHAKRMVVTNSKPRGRMAGGHIHDLAALGKAILLTPTEAKKFNAAAVGYATNPAIPRAVGYSDASGEWSGELVLFQKKG